MFRWSNKLLKYENNKDTENDDRPTPGNAAKEFFDARKTSGRDGKYRNYRYRINA
jgi:hypothetical protein